MGSSLNLHSSGAAVLKPKSSRTTLRSSRLSSSFSTSAAFWYFQTTTLTWTTAAPSQLRKIRRKPLWWKQVKAVTASNSCTRCHFFQLFWLFQQIFIYPSVSDLFGFHDCFIVISAAVITSDTEITIPCSTNFPAQSDLIWRFNHSQIILRRSRAEVSYTPSEEWRQHVKTLSETGSLLLKDLSPRHIGTYTCEFSSAEETQIKHTFLYRTGSARICGHTLHLL